MMLLEPMVIDGFIGFNNRLRPDQLQPWYAG
jgi:hypothetical protein